MDKSKTKREVEPKRYAEGMSAISLGLAVKTW